MKACADRTEDVAAIELGNGQKIERSGEKPDPGGAANGMKQERGGGYTWMQPRSEETQQKRSAEGQVDVMCVVKARNDLRVEQAVGERGDGQNKSHQRTGRAHVKESSSGANR